MRHLSNDDLLIRAGDFLTNLAIHAPDGRIAIREVDLEGDACGSQRFTHVLEEMTIRGIDYRNENIIRAMKMPMPNSPKVMRALEVLSRKKFPENIIVKFGKRTHMGDLLLYGKGRISLSKTYKDDSLGYARSDDESRASAFIDPKDAHRFMVVQEDSTGSQGFDIEVPYLGSAPVEIRATTEFYLYCMAESIQARLFDDFADYDAWCPSGKAA